MLPEGMSPGVVVHLVVVSVIATALTAAFFRLWGEGRSPS
tara:strand:+ start:78 stop:197 length:120 start_codon:yes stop_codon:yes gene_type:complete